MKGGAEGGWGRRTPRKGLGKRGHAMWPAAEGGGSCGGKSYGDDGGSSAAWDHGTYASGPAVPSSSSFGFRSGRGGRGWPKSEWPREVAYDTIQEESQRKGQRKGRGGGGKGKDRLWVRRVENTGNPSAEVEDVGQEGTPAPQPDDIMNEDNHQEDGEGEREGEVHEATEPEEYEEEAGEKEPHVDEADTGSGDGGDAANACKGAGSDDAVPASATRRFQIRENWGDAESDEEPFGTIPLMPCQGGGSSASSPSKAERDEPYHAGVKKTIKQWEARAAAAGTPRQFAPARHTSWTPTSAAASAAERPGKQQTEPESGSSEAAAAPRAHPTLSDWDEDLIAFMGEEALLDDSKFEEQLRYVPEWVAEKAAKRRAELHGE